MAILLSAHPIVGQERDSPSSTGQATATAVRITEPIELDGRLEETAWDSAVPVTSFTQIDPQEGHPASERTEIRILYDDDNMYVGGLFYDRSPVTTRLARRDVVMFDSDKFTLALDTYHDHLTAHRFHANPAAVRRDTKLSGGEMQGGDVTWDPVWDVATTVSDSGWTMEMRIPLSQVPFSEAPEQVWGLQMERFIARRQEESWFAFVPKRESGTIARFGHLVGLEGIERGGVDSSCYRTRRPEPISPPSSTPTA